MLLRLCMLAAMLLLPSLRGKEEEEAQPHVSCRQPYRPCLLARGGGGVLFGGTPTATVTNNA